MHAVPWHRIRRKLPPEEIPLDQVLIGYLCARLRKYKVLRMCSSGGRSLCAVAAAATVCCWCAVRSLNCLRLAALLGALRALDLRNFIVDKLPDDGTLLPKHVAVGT